MKNNLILFLYISFFASQISAQGISSSVIITDTLLINLSNSYRIRSLNILPSTEKIRISSRLLTTSEYKIDYSKGIISLTENSKYSLLDTLFISYKTIKLNLNKEYKRRSLTVRYDDKNLDTIRIVKKEIPFTSESIFGRDMQKSGAIVRGFTIGTNRDFTLNSGLRLQLSGKLSDEIDLVAALTDENTPIQPEGNTEKLDELDKVFIELRHKNAVGIFGDYELNLRDNEFSQITRKLQGLKGEFLFGDTKGTLAIAGSRGKFNTNQFNGSDGNQGPYRLYGINNERAIIIIAGSERIYLDGEQLKRGENNDYIIDYSNSEITFTPKRLITSVSRISVDFEYTDLNYRRNFFGADFSTKLLNDKLKVGIGYFREGDDENSPIDFSFTDDDLNILKSAGDNRYNAARSGVSLALPDSTGKVQGVYTKVDTVISAQQFSYYKYTPGNISSIYNVSFTYVGDGSGDYIKESLGNYKFAGRNNGSYLPIIFLPLPQLKQLGNISLSANILEGIKIDIDLSGSSWDKNKLSTLDDNDNYGYARKILINVIPREMTIGNLSLGKIGISFKDRFIQSQFTSLDRIDEIEFNRYYNLPSQLSKDQTLREAALNYLPSQNIFLNTKYGFLKQGDQFSSDRIFSRLKISEPKLYELNYDIDYVNSKNNTINSNWLRQNGKAFYSFGDIKTGIDFLAEDKKETNSGKDSLLLTSLKYLELAPSIELIGISGFDGRISYSFREESFPLKGSMIKQSNAVAQNYQLNYKGLKEFSTSLSVTFRNKKYTEDFKRQGFSDNETVLLLSQSRLNLWNGSVQGDIYYQAATEQSAKYEKVFLRVPKGTGNYVYIGDLNNNGIPEENEFQITSYEGDFILITIPTDKLFPVMDFKANTRLRIDFSRMFSDDNFLTNFLKPIATETSWRIEENSKEPDTKKIYLMNLSHFLNDSTTIRGTQLFQHDINLFQNSSELSFRLRFLQRKSLNQFSGGIERGYFRERGLRIRFKMIEEINNQTEFINQTDDLISPPTSNRARTVTRNDLTSDFSYRPVRDVEVGFKIATGRSQDDFPKSPTIVDQNSITLRVNLSFENIGRLRIEAERTELTSSSSNFNIPYEITRGNAIGKNYFWRVFFDYRLSGFIQTSLSYDARLQGSSRVIQTMRAEARAYF
ncbi:MAG: hypothetical protein WC879_13865 [Melioribacteraceae bacterium]